MSRKYTAQEIRSKADEFKEYLDNPNHFASKDAAIAAHNRVASAVAGKKEGK